MGTVEQPHIILLRPLLSGSDKNSDSATHPSLKLYSARIKLSDLSQPSLDKQNGQETSFSLGVIFPYDFRDFQVSNVSVPEYRGWVSLFCSGCGVAALSPQCFSKHLQGSTTPVTKVFWRSQTYYA